MTKECSIGGSFEVSNKISGFMKNELTKREKEVISILIKGKSNEQIAKNLHVSVNTIRTHLSSSFKKLNVKNRTELVIKYINQNK